MYDVVLGVGLSVKAAVDEEFVKFVGVHKAFEGVSAVGGGVKIVKFHP